MTGFAYQGYCYPDLNSASIALRSYPSYTSSGVYFISSYFDLPLDSPPHTTLVFVSLSSSNVILGQYNYEYYYPSCANIGPLSTQTGLNISDAFELTSLIVLVWVLAYSIKILRRAL